MTTTPTRQAAWPGLDEVPTGPRAEVSARVARRLFRAAVRRLPVTVREGSDSTRTWGAGGPEMRIQRPGEFFARLGRDGLIGFGEAYMTGAWEADDLGGFLTVLAADLPRLVPAPLQALRTAYVARPPRHQRNTEDNTRNNISHHYDLSNELFGIFLDETLSYSSALFDTSVRERGDHLSAAPPEGDHSEALAAAQARKIDRLLDEAGVRDGTRVLEIGTGWGELAIRAAARGATVHSVTLSSEQLELAERRVHEAGYAGRVSIELCDYRAVSTGPAAGGTYDAVVSVEMIEAVGHEFWPTYFATIDRVLAPGGRVAIQAITMPHDRMLATRNTWTWIHKYIFPGGFLPSVTAIDEATRAHTTLRISNRLAFGRHYAETLARWDAAFMSAREQVEALGLDRTFRRMWHFYLEYSRAGFASGYLDVQQVTLTREEATTPHARPEVAR
ncbi:MAG TPA: cyclopropane-fatty-acyl-phospholipid synthase family protein [Marmoricola sp.]|nr:cyclopropane-fatty-acyl-phospholipid synthase family protein [Marmoricola sp.]